MTLEQLANKLMEHNGDNNCNLLSVLFSIGARYQVKELNANEENIRRNIAHYPIITLNFDFPQWLKYFGSGTLDNWYSSHVICGVSIKDDKLTYFEPLTGSLEEKHFDELRDIYGLAMMVITEQEIWRD